MCCDLQYLKKMAKLMRRMHELPGINSAGCQTGLAFTQWFNQTLQAKAFYLITWIFFYYFFFILLQPNPMKNVLLTKGHC